MSNFKMLIIALLTSTVTLLNATNEVTHLKVNIKAVPGTQKVSVSLQGLSGETTIQLRDPNEVLLLQQVTTDPYMAKILDLSALVEGQYEILLTAGNKEIIQPILMEEDGVSVPLGMRKVYFSPTVKVNGSKVDLSWYTSRIADLSVRITDPSGSVIYAEDINNVIKVEKRYNLEKVLRGNYIIIIDTPRKTYYESVSLVK